MEAIVLKKQEVSAVVVHSSSKDHFAMFLMDVRTMYVSMREHVWTQPYMDMFADVLIWVVLIVNY